MSVFACAQVKRHVCFVCLYTQYACKVSYFNLNKRNLQCYFFKIGQKRLSFALILRQKEGINRVVVRQMYRFVYCGGVWFVVFRAHDVVYSDEHRMVRERESGEASRCGVAVCETACEGVVYVGEGVVVEVSAHDDAFSLMLRDIFCDGVSLRGAHHG